MLVARHAAKAALENTRMVLSSRAAAALLSCACLHRGRVTLPTPQCRSRQSQQRTLHPAAAFFAAASACAAALWIEMEGGRGGRWGWGGSSGTVELERCGQRCSWSGATSVDRVSHVVSTHIGSKFFRPWESVSLGGLALIFVITVEGGMLKRGRRKGKGITHSRAHNVSALDERILLFKTRIF